MLLILIKDKKYTLYFFLHYPDFRMINCFMNQLFVKADAHKAENNHTIMLPLQYDLDFSKKD